MTTNPKTPEARSALDALTAIRDAGHEKIADDLLGTILSRADTMAREMSLPHSEATARSYEIGAATVREHADRLGVRV